MATMKNVIVTGTIKGRTIVLWGNPTNLQTLVASDATVGDGFGIRARFSDNGDYMIVGSYLEDTVASNAGAAYIYVRDGDTWTQQQKIQASDAAASDQFGASVQISGDGLTCIVGARFKASGATTSCGATYIFTRSGTTWTQQRKMLPSTIESAQFGADVILSYDGNTAVISAALAANGAFSSAGASYVWTRSGTTWTQQAKLQHGDPAAGDQFGRFAGLSADGDSLALCAFQKGGGAVYFFTRTTGTWTQRQKILPSNVQASARFGIDTTMSSDGNTVFAAADFEDVTSGSTYADAGAIYVYTRSGNTFTQQARLISPQLQANSQFGGNMSCSSDGNILIASQVIASGLGGGQVFTRVGTSWTHKSTLLPAGVTSDPVRSVSLTPDGGYAVVGTNTAEKVTVYKKH